MSYKTVKRIILKCDECGMKNENPTGKIKEARLIASRFGWDYSGGKDICDKCAERIKQG